MTRFVVDPGAALHLAGTDVGIPGVHRLLAPTQLQADAFVTLDAGLARSVEGVVATASVDDVLRPS